MHVPAWITRMPTLGGHLPIDHVLDLAQTTLVGQQQAIVTSVTLKHVA